MGGVMLKTVQWKRMSSSDTTATMNIRGEEIFTMCARTIYWFWKIPIWIKIRYVDGSVEDLYRYLEVHPEGGISL